MSSALVFTDLVLCIDLEFKKSAWLTISINITSLRALGVLCNCSCAPHQNHKQDTSGKLIGQRDKEVKGYRQVQSQWNWAPVNT